MKDLSQSFDADTSRELLVEEYRSLHTYYIRTLDERHKVIDYYFKSVTIPAGVFAGFALLSNSPDYLADPRLTVAALLAILFAAGASLYTYYVSESQNSKRYLAAMKSVRVFARRNSDILREAMTLDDQYLQTRVCNIDFALFRAGPIVSINSGVLAFSLIFAGIASNLGGTIVFFVSILLHVAYWIARPKAPILKPDPEIF